MNNDYEKISRKFSILFRLFLAGLFNLQSKSRALIIGEMHYDLGNDLFQNTLIVALWLDYFHQRPRNL